MTRKPVYILITLAILTPMFFFGGPGHDASHQFQKLWNLGHILYFALFALLVRHYTNKWPMGFHTRAALILLLTLLVGVAVELIQAGLERTADFGDLIRNLVGALVGISFLLPERKTLAKGPVIALKTVTTALIVLQLYPIFVSYADDYYARSQFPVLADFETPFELERWTGSADYELDTAIRHAGRYALKVSLKTTLYSGVRLRYFPENWEGRRQLQFSVCNPSAEPIEITCCIFDRLHTKGLQEHSDRFNRKIVLPQGWSTLTVDLEEVRHAPRNRQMDMRHINGIAIFATALKHPHTIFVDDIQLT